MNTTTNTSQENTPTNNDETPNPVMDEVSSELSKVINSIQLQRSLASALTQKTIENK